MSARYTVEAVDYHRNGIYGAGAHVALFRDRENVGRHFLAVLMEYEEDDPSPCILVLDVDEAAKGNIYMHPQVDGKGNVDTSTGGNAWRGVEGFPALQGVIRASMEVEFARRDAAYKLRRAKLAAEASS